jgi:DNA-directed RNA polymerase subunit alpha
MKITGTPKFTEEVINETRSRFTLEPLEPGFGYTLGNSIRRTLLSSIPGAAVTSVKIDGVLHEYDTVPGVREDVVNIILAIKQLSISSSIDESVLGVIDFSGEGDITGKDIKLPTGVEVHNKDLHIASCNKGAKVHIEVTVERGRGYVSVENYSTDYTNGGHIPIDAIYTPVLQVSYRVDPTRVREHTNFDKLIIDVRTKSSISPADAISSSASTLIELLGLIKTLNPNSEGLELEDTEQFEEYIEVDLSQPITSLDLTTGANNALNGAGIETIEQLIATKKSDLAKLKGFGTKALETIAGKLTELGLGLED